MLSSRADADADDSAVSSGLAVAAGCGAVAWSAGVLSSVIVLGDEEKSVFVSWLLFLVS